MHYCYILLYYLFFYENYEQVFSMKPMVIILKLLIPLPFMLLPLIKDLNDMGILIHDFR